MFTVVKHKLHHADGTPVPFTPSPNVGTQIVPIYIVIHYTAGLTADGAIETLCDPKSKASAHVVLDRDGKVTQLVTLNRRAWHAGKSQWGELSGMNSHSIGIEIVNAGKLTHRADGSWVSWSKKPIPTNEVGLATHKNEHTQCGWHEYTEQQVEAAVALCTAMASAYSILDVLGHDDVAPNRKVDPGPLFPLDSVRARVLGRQD